ncbi:MAG TPA: 50S ribosomal protein L21 [Candidatus Aminicenantes bacterium]|nr:50S ribosomal protein L21 [Candidatus Aminicenantes bacterium]HRY64052.1 50S ribosomal protein L21 [Candidatus Aminicenantes bacterium]HRZ70965.1 50S ribosomal protein L21 [Candidatus Aminicenantes bacterium]
MYAVILTGGKQYRVKEGDVLAVEKLDLEPGRKAQFDRVLLIEDGGMVQVGTPVLDSAMVLGLVLENFKDEKVLVFKKKRRKQFRRTRGHRQQLTKVRITRIAADRTTITAEDLAEEKPVPVAAPAPVAKPKPAAAAEKPAKAAAPAKPAGKEAAKPKAAKKPAPAKAKKASKE